jgi:2-C-methyl-D-erythritol 4-phosphate cytidylyltransferase
MSSDAPASITAVIAAAGSGERLGAGGPKAFLPLAGRPMLDWSLEAFLAAGVGAVVVACPPELVAGSSSRYLDAGRVGPDGESPTFVAGGTTRAESVSNGLRLVETELVAIHDAARPLVTPQLIEGVARTLLDDPEAAAAVAATPVSDTIKRVPGTNRGLTGLYEAKTRFVVSETVDRAELWAAQTPQVFRSAALRGALDVGEAARAAATDEATLVEAAGGRVLIHPAAPENLKVTTPLDLRLAELLLAGRTAG